MQTAHMNFTTLTAIDDGGAYTIPSYQRPYSWQNYQWEGLIEDFTKMVKDTFKHGNTDYQEDHFLGAVVRHGHGKTRSGYYIVDGQQRMITLSLLTAAWMNVLMTYFDKSLLIKEQHHLTSLRNLIQIDTSIIKSMPIVETVKIHPLTVDATAYYDIMVSTLYNYTNNDIIQIDFSFDKNWTTQIADYINSMDKNVYDYLVLTYPPKSFEDISSTSPQRVVTKKNHELFIQKTEAHKIYQAYDYLYQALLKFAENYFKDISPQLAIEHTSMIFGKAFSFATITVEHNERPQEIFESLNARSVQLTSFDLIKNYILMSSHTDDIESMDIFYTENWLHFEMNNFWKDIYPSSKLTETVDRRSLFLNYWLEANTFSCDEGVTFDDYYTEKLSKDADGRFHDNDGVFWAYRKELQNKDQESVREFNSVLSSDSKLHHEIVKAVEESAHALIMEEASYSSEGKRTFPILSEWVKTYSGSTLVNFVDRCINKLEFHTLWKLVLWLVGDTNSKKLEPLVIDGILTTIESWIIRREAFGRPKSSTFDGINIIFEYLKFMQNQSPDLTGNKPRLDKALIKYLQVNSKTELQWPIDESMNAKIPTVSFSAKKELAGIILRAIEDHQRGFYSLTQPSAETNLYRAPAQSVVEYILPKKYEGLDWKNPQLTVSEEIKKDQKKIINQLGNHVLLPKNFSEHSNYSWLTKKEEIRKLSHLDRVESKATYRYNQKILDNKDWDSITIRNNTESLIKIFNTLWTVPHMY